MVTDALRDIGEARDAYAQLGQENRAAVVEQALADARRLDQQTARR
jgi:hypothetical protein